MHYFHFSSWLGRLKHFFITFVYDVSCVHWAQNAMWQIRGKEGRYGKILHFWYCKVEKERAAEALWRSYSFTTFSETEDTTCKTDKKKDLVMGRDSIIICHS